jgi:endonuclease-3
MNPAKRGEIFSRLRQANPHPTTELLYTTPFELLIAVLLSAQATDVSVNKVTRLLYPVANTPQAILALGEEELIPYLRTIGLFRNKAKNVIATCRILVEQYGGEVPRDREALESLPGVGRKTANVVLNTAFGEPTIAVDTHIFRVSNRTGRDRRAEADEVRGAGIPPGRAPLADPARPLHLHRPQAAVLELPHRRPVRIQAEDAGAGRRVRQSPSCSRHPSTTSAASSAKPIASTTRATSSARSRRSPPAG